MKTTGAEELLKRKILQNLPYLTDVHRETITLDRPFEDIAASFAQEQGTVLLLSGSKLDSSQYNILAIKPWLEIKSLQKAVSIQYGEKEFCIQQNPFSTIQALLDRFKFNSDNLVLPVLSGLFGYFAYDLKDLIEKLPSTCKETGLPDLCLYAPLIVLIQDKNLDNEIGQERLSNQATLCISILSDELEFRTKKEIINKNRQFFFDKLKNNVKRKSFGITKLESGSDFKSDSKFGLETGNVSGFQSSLTKEKYISSVNKIIDYLRAGDIYQANLSQRFEAKFSGDTYSWFQDLFKRNPAPFFSYINANDHTIISTSPERFIRQKGRLVESRPIKGTIARGSTKEQDKKNGMELAKSSKDDAELTMIVDLMRNDISRVTKHGSVIVREHKRVEAYENVFHLVSVVEGELENDKTSVDLLKATFPGGSITGCPKIRSMEIIDELESIKRHVYTGSIGYISFHDTMDLSIAIRTATIADNKVWFSVGGGIVYDSDPEKEFQETLDKGKTLMESLSCNINDLTHTFN